MNSPVWIGVLSSLAASVLYGLMALFVTQRLRKLRAKPFIGKFRMFGLDGLKPTGGSVRITHEKLMDNLFAAAPILTVFAEHGSGKAPGTEDWEGTVEVLGLSKTANGYYWYRNGTGGALRFMLSADANEITEYGTPFDTRSEPFRLVLKRDQ